MKKFIAIPALLAVLALAVTVAHSAAQNTPKKELITGNITCLYCYASEANQGEDPTGCVTRCLMKKDMPPVLIQEGTDEPFMLVWKNGEPAKTKLADFIGKKVNAQGFVYNKKGIKVLEMLIIAEAI